MDEDVSLRELIARLIDNLKAYVRAEIALVKQTGVSWIGAAKPAIAFLAIALLLVQAALTVLLAALGLGLGRWLGPAGGMAVGALIGLAIAGLLAWLAVKRLSGVNK